MPSIADLLGVQWDAPDPAPFRLSAHARTQCATKGFDVEAVLAAANDPAHTYENGRYPGQWRHVRGTVCAVVDLARREVVTVYVNVAETDLREDQRAGENAQDALAYERNRRRPSPPARPAA